MSQNFQAWDKIPKSESTVLFPFPLCRE